MATMICPSCGHSIPTESTFCPDCGFKLTENETHRSSRLAEEESTQLHRRQRVTNSWQRRLIPNVTNLKRVGRFIVNNGWFLLFIYVISLIFNQWRWGIFALFILSSYLYPLLTGQDSFGRPQRHPSRRDVPADQQFDEPEQVVKNQSKTTAQQTQFRKPAKSGRFHFKSNLEFQTGSILIIPSLVCYLVAKQLISKRGIQIDQIFNQTSLGTTADVYFISLGVLGIATAMILGGLVKSMVHHPFGGQKFKRWGVITAVLTILLAVAMYQDTVTATSAGAIVSAVGAFLMPFLPWLAAIFYGLGIVKNLLTPQKMI
ncbi:membrane protein [Secundilactobacillus silagincola]|uniref:Membrane protein n=1 Tax=Secundilactobacillus silagincola TaxID=1714681 RepID=A0A1Z5J1R8_9LACO|nr:zinc ribbon domain-containing protein [Secundilactobacillus silagincola]GAX07742.1 membrane protein [Secundilactobacillus silagincola]